MTIREVFDEVKKFRKEINKKIDDLVEKKADKESCEQKHSGLKAFNIVNIIAYFGLLVSIVALFFKK